MPTDAGIVTRAEVGQWREVFSGLPGYDPKHTPLKLLTTIEQFADALRGECKCIWHEHGGKFYSCDWCKRRNELLSAYDGKEAGHGMATD